jgi:hypothetical protein
MRGWTDGLSWTLSLLFLPSFPHTQHTRTHMDWTLSHTVGGNWIGYEVWVPTCCIVCSAGFIGWLYQQCCGPGAGAGNFDKPELEPDQNGPAPQYRYCIPVFWIRNYLFRMQILIRLIKEFKDPNSWSSSAPGKKIDAAPALK